MDPTTNKKQNMTPNRIGKLLKISVPDMKKHKKIQKYMKNMKKTQKEQNKLRKKT